MNDSSNPSFVANVCLKRNSDSLITKPTIPLIIWLPISVIPLFVRFFQKLLSSFDITLGEAPFPLPIHHSQNKINHLHCFFKHEYRISCLTFWCAKPNSITWQQALLSLNSISFLLLTVHVSNQFPFEVWRTALLIS